MRNGNSVKAPQASTQYIATNSQRVMTAREVANLVKPSVALLSTPQGVGSGFVIAGGKYIVTNAHVVGFNTTVRISLPSGSFNAPVVGKDDSADIALLYAGDHDLPSLTLGSSAENALSLGDDVYVLGFPLSSTEGLTSITLTRGIISARQKPTWARQPLLQTDAAINHGSSGGPMVNNKGEVVGIGTYTDAGLFSQTQGIYFAIPIDAVKGVIATLSQNDQNRHEAYSIGGIKITRRNAVLSTSFSSLSS